MGFDPVAFAMGKAGLSRDVLSALIGGSGGGGVVPGSLEESGWVNYKYGNITVNGNEVVISTGNKSTSMQMRPPDAKKFVSGDVLQLAITVKSLTRINFAEDGSTNVTATSKTGLFVHRWSPPNGEMYCTTTGDDVLTLSFAADSASITINAVSSSGSTSTSAHATFDITGIKLNGTVIYGKV